MAKMAAMDLVVKAELVSFTEQNYLWYSTVLCWL